MGREAQASCTFRGQTGTVRVLLEQDEIILRGEIKARIPRHTVTGHAPQGDDLVIATLEGPVHLALGAELAGKWSTALAKPPPDLAQKLGISRASPVWVIGEVTDPALIAALNGATTQDVGKAAVALAELATQGDLASALQQLAGLPGTSFWGVTLKGKTSPLSENQLRQTMRAAGYVDSKSCAVSALRTATRFGLRR